MRETREKKTISRKRGGLEELLSEEHGLRGRSERKK
jgi:hypothetical protein